MITATAQSPAVGQLVAICASSKLETRFGVARISHVEATPEGDGWYIGWNRVSGERIGSGGSAHMPGRGRYGITAVPVEAGWCQHCGQPITSDPYDSHGKVTETVVWRTRNGRGDCHADTWHQPASEHTSRCSWLVRCPEHN